jgi:hypothetical protein
VKFTEEYGIRTKGSEYSANKKTRVILKKSERGTGFHQLKMLW